MYSRYQKIVAINQLIITLGYDLFDKDSSQRIIGHLNKLKELLKNYSEEISIKKYVTTFNSDLIFTSHKQSHVFSPQDVIDAEHYPILLTLLFLTEFFPLNQIVRINRQDYFTHPTTQTAIHPDNSISLMGGYRLDKTKIDADTASMRLHPHPFFDQYVFHIDHLLNQGCCKESLYAIEDPLNTYSSYLIKALSNSSITDPFPEIKHALTSIKEKVIHTISSEEKHVASNIFLAEMTEKNQKRTKASTIKISNVLCKDWEQVSILRFYYEEFHKCRNNIFCNEILSNILEEKSPDILRKITKKILKSKNGAGSSDEEVTLAIAFLITLTKYWPKNKIENDLPLDYLTKEPIPTHQQLFMDSGKIYDLNSIKIAQVSPP